MADIYEQHTSAFLRVSAYAILKDGKPVAKIAFKYPADGAGRLYVYVQWLGIEMVRDFASGFGYDKHSAACYSASARLPIDLSSESFPDGITRDFSETESANFALFRAALRLDDGYYWNVRLRNAGFEVFGVV